MPRRIFKRFAFKRHELSQKWFMTPFRHMLNDPRLWGVRRRWVVPAFAIGLFVAYLPFLGHTVIAMFIALALRVNIPVAAVSSWVGNPATWVPMYYLAYRLGSAILGTDMQPFDFEPSFDWMRHTFVHIWQPLLLGSLLLGAATATLGYFALDGLWRLSLAKYKARKRGTRQDSA